VIPPRHNAEFVAHMEDILEIYKRRYDPAIPVICMDEQPTQLIKETRMRIAAEPGKPERVDYEYERNGTAANFMFTEPLGGWRKLNVRPQRTSIDWAQEIKELLDEDYPVAQKVILVCDNLNTHKIGVKGRSKPATMGALKTSHFEERMACHSDLVKSIMLDFMEGRYGQPAQDGCGAYDFYVKTAGLVPAAYCPDAGDQSGDGRQVYSPSAGGAKTSQRSAHRVGGGRAG